MCVYAFVLPMYYLYNEKPPPEHSLTKLPRTGSGPGIAVASTPYQQQQQNKHVHNPPSSQGSSWTFFASSLAHKHSVVYSPLVTITTILQISNERHACLAVGKRIGFNTVPSPLRPLQPLIPLPRISHPAAYIHAHQPTDHHITPHSLLDLPPFPLQTNRSFFLVRRRVVRRRWILASDTTPLSAPAYGFMLFSTTLTTSSCLRHDTGRSETFFRDDAIFMHSSLLMS
mmetsp:Transcript_11743/g.24169  ORF Transcript_11743/g.24169 Transcript_11743/m.24169 type:complete len:228 (-) Transcript_11743:311-994(-)